MFPPETPTAEFPYRIEGKIGTGSMGIVYRAVEIALERTVAIKVLRQSVLDEEPPEVQRELKRRFLQEARAAAVLAHPGVTTVYGVGECEGLPYLVMEWLDGTTLEEVLRTRSRFDLVSAARLTVALLDVLNAAHRGGVVHRDIKPSNLVILRDGRLKVTDFGIALVRGRELVKTEAGVVLATPKFASPEQLQGIEVDGRSDLFAVGILLFRLVTGEFPFGGAGFMELANAILLKEPPAVRELRPELPAAVEAVIQRALRKNREDRFPNALEMAASLRPFTQTEVATPAPGALPLAGEGRSAARMPEPALHRDMPTDPRLAMARVVQSWPGRDLGRQPTGPLLDRLLERPLHAPPFGGGVVIGRVCLLICDGMLLGAIDTVSGESGDAVAERLDSESSPWLYPAPAGFPAGSLALLASVLHPPRYRHADLDSSFINLPALARKLQDERFEGIFRLSRGDGYGLIFFTGGRLLLSVYSEGWEGVPIDQSWQHWISRVPVRASVEEKQVKPLADWYRKAFAGIELEVQPAGAGGARRSDEIATPPARAFASSLVPAAPDWRRSGSW